MLVDDKDDVREELKKGDKKLTEEKKCTRTGSGRFSYRG
jgi:hypothetical protein